MRITWLADVLRAAGLTVVEHAGWTTRARPGSWEPRFIVAHATAAPVGQADETQVRIVRDGRADLAGPIANACLDRQGRWHVLAAGRCNTTLAGTAGPFEGLGNTNALGIEACNDNRGEPWPSVQYQAYVTGVAAICRRMGWPESRVVGHREHTPGRKSDPTFGMHAFRELVRAAILNGDDDVSAQDVWEADLIPVNGKQDTWQAAGTLGAAYDQARAAAAGVARLEAAIAQLAGRDLVDEPAIVAGVLAGLTPEVFAAAMNTAGLSPQALAALIPAAIRQEVADELAARLAS